MLANIDLHSVLDEWFEDEIKPTLQSEAILIRSADDFVLTFTHREEPRPGNRRGHPANLVAPPAPDG